MGYVRKDSYFILSLEHFRTEMCDNQRGSILSKLTIKPEGSSVFLSKVLLHWDLEHTVHVNSAANVS